MNQSKDKTTGIKVDLVNYTLFSKLRACGQCGFEIFSSIYMLILLGDFNQLNLFVVDLYYNDLHVL